MGHPVLVNLRQPLTAYIIPDSPIRFSTRCILARLKGQMSRSEIRTTLEKCAPILNQ